MPSDRETAELILSGESRMPGVELLFTLHSRRFKKYFIRHGLAETQADDLVQDVFVNIVRHIGDFRGDCPLEAWLWKIARNSLIDFIRKNREETGWDEEVLDGIASSRADMQTNPTEATGLEECVKTRFSLFAKKHPDRAQSLALLVLKDIDIPDLATILDRTAGATREYLSQCRKMLRPFLEDCLSYLRS